MSVKNSTSWFLGLFLFAAGILIGFTSNPHNPLFNHDSKKAEEPSSPYGPGATYCELTTEELSVRLAPDITKDLIDIINQMGLSKYASDNDRVHDESAPYQIMIHYGDSGSTVDIHFNSDFTMMWTRDSKEDKNSLSYQIHDPQQIKEFFAKWEQDYRS